MPLADPDDLAVIVIDDDRNVDVALANRRFINGYASQVVKASMRVLIETCPDPADATTDCGPVDSKKNQR